MTYTKIRCNKDLDTKCKVLQLLLRSSGQSYLASYKGIP